MAPQVCHEANDRTDAVTHSLMSLHTSPSSITPPRAQATQHRIAQYFRSFRLLLNARTPRSNMDDLVREDLHAGPDFSLRPQALEDGFSMC